MTETGATPSKDPTAEAGKSEDKAQPPKPTEKAEPVATTVKQENVAAVAATGVDEKADEMSHPMRVATRPHAFVIMPFGKKKGADGSLYDFNAIYKILIKPALEDAGFEPFRADEETASGDILTDMFQELLLADLCLCDLSIDNANVFYEVGIRHAFRKRGVVHIQAGRAYMPFDVFNVRTLPYHITVEGVPDPDYIKSDIQAIARMAKDTWASDRDTIHSPIFNLLTGLKEPERKMLRTASATGFWREFTEWMDKVTIAQRQKRIGDILLLTEEIGNPLIKEDAIGEAGRALADMGRHELALVQYRKGLEVNAENVTFRREEAFHLNRIGKVDDAIVKLEKLLNDYPRDSEATSYLGRIYKEMWVDSWKDIKDKNKRVKAAFNSYHWLIKAIKIYMKGFEIDLNNTYPGVNALTLSYMAIHLADKFDNKEDPDPAIEQIRAGIADLRGALLFALESKAQREPVGYWTLISLAEVRVLTADNLANVTRAYRTALTASRRNISYLTTSINQLQILKGVGVREDYVQAGLDTLQEEINRMDEEDNVPSVSKKYISTKEREEGQVFLFTGYMVDFPSKEKKTFPADKEQEVRVEIRKKLEKFNAGPNDIAFVGGLSAGGEIIFAEVCAEKGIHVEAHLPLTESSYIREFVSPGGEAWVDRFYKVRSHPLVDEMYQLENIGEPKNGDDPYERNNRWTLYSSLVRGIDKVRLIALWNGQGGKSKDRDARLVRHMIELMRDTGGAIEQINPSKYIHTFIDGAFDGLPDLSKPAPVVTPKAPSKPRLSEKKQKKI
jgi:tetratricopeptide (TPR) repeat protein